jgi:Skp family chaperone for outer membrane proteins
MQKWRALIVALSALAASPVAATPSAIPNDGGAQVVEGAPFVDYNALVAALPEWQAHYVELNRQFAPFDQGLQQYRAEAQQIFAARDALSVKADAAIGPARSAALAELKLADAKAHDTAVAVTACESLLSYVYAKREDALLNPLAPALLAALGHYAKSKAMPRVLILSSELAPTARNGKMRDVTAEFVAWRKTQVQ